MWRRRRCKRWQRARAAASLRATGPSTPASPESSPPSTRTRCSLRPPSQSRPRPAAANPTGLPRRQRRRRRARRGRALQGASTAAASTAARRRRWRMWRRTGRCGCPSRCFARRRCGRTSACPQTRRATTRGRQRYRACPPCSPSLGSSITGAAAARTLLRGRGGACLSTCAAADPRGLTDSPTELHAVEPATRPGARVQKSLNRQPCVVRRGCGGPGRASAHCFGFAGTADDLSPAALFGQPGCPEARKFQFPQAAPCMLRPPHTPPTSATPIPNSWHRRRVGRRAAAVM